MLDIKVGERFKRGDVDDELSHISENIGHVPEYRISDGAHNLVGGFKDAVILHLLDISHTLGYCMKRAYGSTRSSRRLPRNSARSGSSTT